MRLEKLQKYLSEKEWEYTYVEEDGLGSVDFIYRGVSYHVWEFRDGEYGAESNVENAGRQEDFMGCYEDTIIDIIEHWQ